VIGSQQAQSAENLANIGSTELGHMLNALNIGSSVAQSDINSRRAASASMWSALIGGAAGFGTGLVSKMFAPKTGGPPPTDTSSAPQPVQLTSAPPPFQYGSPQGTPLPGMGVFNPGSLSPGYPPPGFPELAGDVPYYSGTRRY
jgi:hypothetical protein